MKALPKVSIVIVNFNGEKFIEKCLKSLNKTNYPPNKTEIILIDNGSKDSSLDIVKNKFPKVKIIKNSINNYCKANNLGIQNSNGELIAFLNNDTEVYKDWLIELVRVIQTNEKIGAVGPKLIFPTGHINSAGQREHPLFYFKDEGFKEKDKGQYDKLREVESICGCAVLYKKGCIKDIGIFDEDLIMYCDDVDMSIRCRKKGWKLYYVPKSIVKHEYNGTSSLELQEKYVERNRLILLAKHFPDKLPSFMFSSAYFRNNDEIFQIIPEVIKKIINIHGQQKFEEISKDFFKNMKDYFYLKKDYLIKDFEIEKDMFKESKDRLRHSNKKLEQELKMIKKENKKLSESQEKLNKQYDKEIKKNNDLHRKYTKLKKEIIITKTEWHRQVKDLKKELINAKKETEKVKTNLKSLYDSKGYKWILSNIWAVSNKLKKEKNDNQKPI